MTLGIVLEEFIVILSFDCINISLYLWIKMV